MIRESHIDDICINCKKPHGRKEIEMVFHHHKTYELITCLNCGYKTINIKKEVQFHNKFEFI